MVTPGVQLSEKRLNKKKKKKNFQKYANGKGQQQQEHSHLKFSPPAMF